MSYTTFLGDTFENEHDEELTRKFGDAYKYFKKQYPELYKLPTEEVRGIFYEFNKSPYGDTLEKSIARTNQYIQNHMPDWQEQYINPEASLEGTQTICRADFEPEQKEWLDWGNREDTVQQKKIEPQLWETAEDGARVYHDVIKQEGNFIPPKQSMVPYGWAYTKAGINMVWDHSKLSNMRLSDKYKHAYMNCKAAQLGEGGYDAAIFLSDLKELKDKETGNNTRDSSAGDQYANQIGRLLGGKYPDGDCDELVQRHIKKWYE